MKLPDLNRLIPLGMEWERVRRWLTAGLILCGLWNCRLYYLYFTVLDSLYYQANGKKVLYPDAQMPPFAELAAGSDGYDLYPYFFAAMAILAGWHYLYHRMGSRADYLMRRLPDRWELHRRCLTIPVLGSLAALILGALETGLGYVLYLLFTPAQFLT